MSITDPGSSAYEIPTLPESTNSQSSRVTFVYVIASGPRNVKIGYSIDPERRLAQLQTGHERRLSLVHKEPVPDQQAPLIEKRIHHANRHKYLHGEWFDLTPTMKRSEKS